MRDTQGEGALTALLDWYRAMGVDQAAGDTSIDWLQRGDVPPGHEFRRSAPPKPAGASLPQTAPETPRTDRSRGASAPLPSRATRPFSTVAPDAAILAARGAAREAATLDELAARLTGFDGCSLKATAKSLCFYRGAPKARVML